MNILIVGNGFDLSHYLPTKYDHFMDAMQEIENKKLEKPVTDLLEIPLDLIGDLIIKYFQFKTVVNKKTYEIDFNQLFINCRDSGFISKTSDFYNVENSRLSFEQIVELQFRLAKNCWYQYFKKHVQDVKTWIDFEQKIENALVMISNFQNMLNEDFKNCGYIKEKFGFLKNSDNYRDKNFLYLAENHFDVLVLLKLCRKNIRKRSPSSEEGYIENRWFTVSESPKYGLNHQNYLSFLQVELGEFIEIFNLYLELIVDKLKPKRQFKIESKDWIQPDHIFSFNYTNTFQKFYSPTNTEFLHGCFGKEQNIVLGISDLEDESLKKLKAYGFTKYHQKLFKDTDYLFLDECSEVKQQMRSLIYSGNDINFCIWGHSLDRSDQEYIKEIFELNDNEDAGVRVTVYFFNESAKFELLNNLLDILKKDKVEKWMKNKWLIFEKNPEVKLVETIPKQTV
ncbi:AbiH family protein [Acinetobacter faecalis]|uniref:AbiH family protein n=1 Tax=Acinetobacter faecalis TaxID=2665161 RepID=UPI002A90AC57|nr:AbiH family protein [Acinetobacter faecalis]MDY6449361.1 AbiH family protein [Acinetobacter faecalis]